MHSTAVMKRSEQVLEEMRRHRQATPVKRPIHAGMTRVEAGLTPQEAERLLDGVCADLADRTERGERWANRVLKVLAVALLLLLAGPTLLRVVGLR